MTEENGRNWMSCLGGGCLALVVISILGIGGCVAYLYRGGSAAHSVANAYLESVDAGRYEEAFQSLGPRFTEDRGIGAICRLRAGRPRADGLVRRLADERHQLQPGVGSVGGVADLSGIV